MPAGVLVQIALKVSMIFAAAWIVSAAMRRSSAAARHLIWSIAILATLIVPAVVIYGPAWSLPVLPETAPLRAERFALVEPPGPSSQASVVSALRRTSGLAEAGHYEYEVNWGPLLVVLWVAGALIGLVRLTVGLVWVSWSARRARRVADWTWLALAEEAAAALDLKTHILLRSSDRTTVPLTCGLWRPVLLMPVEAKGWSADRRRVVLLHELAHVKRRDCLVQAIAQAACAVHWFNPLAQLAVRRLRVEQERACDDLVLAAGTAAPDYADHLFEIARAFRATALPGWATLAMARLSQLEGRMLSILDSTRRRETPSRRVRVLATLTVGVGALLVGALRLSAGPGSPAATSNAARPASQASISGPIDFVHGDTAIRTLSRTVTDDTLRRAADALTAALNDENQQVRQEAIQALAVMPGPSEIPLSIESPCRGNCNFGDTPWTLLWTMFAAKDLQSDDVEVRKAAVRRLGRNSAGVAALTQALLDSDPGVRTLAAIRLDSARSSEAVPGWISLLQDADPSLRERAAISLGVIGDPGAIDALRAALQDAQPVVRQQAARALGNIAWGYESELELTQ